MLRPSTELCHGWRQPGVLQSGEYFRGPDVPAGFHFFGLPVYRTYIQVRVTSGITTVQIPFPGVSDFIDVWGCERTLVQGAVRGVVDVMAWNNAGTNGATVVRMRCSPSTGVLEVVSGGINEMGASNETRPFPDAQIDAVVFWTR